MGPSLPSRLEASSCIPEDSVESLVECQSVRASEQARRSWQQERKINSSLKLPDAEHLGTQLSLRRCPAWDR